MGQKMYRVELTEKQLLLVREIAWGAHVKYQGDLNEMATYGYSCTDPLAYEVRAKRDVAKNVAEKADKLLSGAKP